MSLISKKPSKNGNMVWEVSTEPAIEPVTTAEFKEFARVDGSSEDTLIDGFIKSSRILTERFLNRKLITQTITASMDFWPSKRLVLPSGPLQSITEIKTIDEDATETTYSSDNYYIRTIPIKGEIVIKDGASFPLSDDRVIGGIEIDYVVGYGDAATDIPQLILEGIKLWANALYAKRVVPGDEPPPEAFSMLFPYRVNNV
jgi:uncharacterized phiE125 gp8 family phage protein